MWPDSHLLCLHAEQVKYYANNNDSINCGHSLSHTQHTAHTAHTAHRAHTARTAHTGQLIPTHSRIRLIFRLPACVTGHAKRYFNTRQCVGAAVAAAGGPAAAPPGRVCLLIEFMLSKIFLLCRGFDSDYIRFRCVEWQNKDRKHNCFCFCLQIFP